MTRILITGPSGFIGTHCLQQLLRRSGDFHAVSRTGKGDSQAGITWHACDLRNAAQAVALVAEVRPSLLLHAAWIATPGVYASTPENIEWMQATTAMAVAFGANGGTRFVGIGTSAEYDPGEQGCIEDETPIRPSTVYGKCKAATWLAIQAAAQHYGFAAAWARLFLPYGPGDSPHRLIPSIVNSLIASMPVRTTEGLQKRDFIYAPDAAELIVKLLFSDEVGAFNVGTGVPSTVRYVIEHLAACCGKPDLVQFGAIKPASSEPPVLVADMTKVRERLGWSASTDLRRGLDRVLAGRLERLGGFEG
jgi:nucleoside-diphosphate-sugar epimerase